MSGALQDKIAIVTGAGRGLGKVFALKYAAEGAKLLLTTTSLERAEKTVEEIRANGGEAVAIVADIADEGATQAVAERVTELYGGVDILLNNAALSYGVEPRPWNEWTVEFWDKLFDINVKGTWLMCRAVAPLMVEREGGKIINISSDVPMLPQAANMLPYGCTKVAIHQITQALARALGPSGICVNTIAPGLTATEGITTQPHSEELFTRTIAAQCIKRREEPEDLVGAAVFLASAGADMVTGQLLIVNGGAAFA